MKNAGAQNSKIEMGIWKQGEESSTVLAKLPLNHRGKKKTSKNRCFPNSSRFNDRQREYDFWRYDEAENKLY